MPDPEVSVVVPFLNAGRFLEECIASVIAQSYTSWELVLVNDGSTDNSAAIARAHVAGDPSRVRCFQHPGAERRGASAARNLGIRRATGRYIAFLDADDVWLPGKLAAQVAILEAHPEAAMAYNRTQFWFCWTGDVEDRRPDYMERLGVAPNTLIAPPTLLSLILREESPVPCTCSVLIRREAVERVGGFEESFFDLFTDQAFYANFLSSPVLAADNCWDRIVSILSVVVPPRNALVDPAVPASLSRVARTISRRSPRAWHECLGCSSARPRGVPEADQSTRCVDAMATAGRHARATGPGPGLVAAALARSGLRTTGGPDSVRDLRRTTPLTRTWQPWPALTALHRAFLARNAKHSRSFSKSARSLYGAVRLSQRHLQRCAQHGGRRPQTPIVADLSRPEQLPADRFDCVIITQTLQLIDDVRTAIGGLHRMLRPGGVVLATLPGISQTHHGDWGGHWRWNFTALSARTLFESAFTPGDVTVETRGNVLAATAFLQGLAAEDLHRDELDHEDRDYQVSILVRAVKSSR